MSGTQLALTAEGAWDSKVVRNDPNFGSGGGGTMSNYTLPDWQKGIDMSVNVGQSPLAAESPGDGEPVALDTGAFGSGEDSVPEVTGRAAQLLLREVA